SSSPSPRCSTRTTRTTARPRSPGRGTRRRPRSNEVRPAGPTRRPRGGRAGRHTEGSVMAKKAASADNLNLTDLVGRIPGDAGTLIGQQIELLTTEVRQELRQAAGAAGRMAAGGGLTAVAGLMSGLMLAHLLHKATGLPLWASYGAVAGGLGAAGAALLRSGG